MRTKFNKLTGFEKFQVVITGIIFSTLVMTVVNWGLNGFVSTF